MAPPMTIAAAIGRDRRRRADPQRSARTCSPPIAHRRARHAILAVGAGSARLEMAIRDDMLNGHDICHGGFITTLADSAFAFACNSRNELTVASGLTSTFLAPVKRGDVLTADAVEVARPAAPASTTSSSPTAPARASRSSAAARRGSAIAPSCPSPREEKR
jgi:phenylacetic acid degradation protein PaaD